MSARIPDNNGWFEIAANPLSKAGVYAYKGSSIRAPDPNKTYQVYRPAEELSNPETMNSFRLVPFVNDHTMLGNATTGDAYLSPQQKGVHGVIGDKVYFDPDLNTLFANLKVFSPTMEKLLAGGKADLSLGYKCAYDWTPGNYNGIQYDCVQRRIRGNHVALVQDGRMGDDVSVMDGDDVVSEMIITFDAKDAVAMAESLKKRNPKAHDAIVKKVVGAFFAGLKNKPNMQIAAMDAADDEAVASEPTLTDVAGILQDVLPQIAAINEAMCSAGGGASADPGDDLEPEMDEAGNPVMDAATGKPKMNPKAKAVPAVPAATATDGKPPTMDAAAMDAAIEKAVSKALKSAPTAKSLLSDISKRDDLAKSLSHFVGTFDHREMTLDDVAKYGVKKLEIPTMDGHEVSAVTAWLHGRVPARPTHTVATMDSKSGGKSAVDSFLNGA